MGNTPAAGQPVAPERVVARLRRHGRVLAWPALVLVAVCAAVGYLSGSVSASWQAAVLYGGGALLVLLLCVLPLVGWLTRRYTITTRRIILRHGFFVSTRQELLHSRGYDIGVRRNWLQSAFRSGDVLVNADLDRPVVLRDVPKADLVRAALQDLSERAQVRFDTGGQPDPSALPGETRVWGRR